MISSLEKRLAASDKRRAHTTQIAWWLVEKVTKLTRAQLAVARALTLSDEHMQQLDKMIHELTVEKKPLQYVLETVPFCNLTLKVHPPIFIPRPETEEICLWLIERLRKSGKNDLNILELCSGTGAISLSLAKAFPNAQVTGVDINPDAVDCAANNAAYNNITNATFILSDLFENVKNKKFDIIVSNPPYVSHEEWETMEDAVRHWEDKRAFVASANGLAVYGIIIKEVHRYLTKTEGSPKSIPSVVFEIGEKQAPDLQKLLADAGYSDIEVFTDFAGKNRWISARF